MDQHACGSLRTLDRKITACIWINALTSVRTNVHIYIYAIYVYIVCAGRRDDGFGSKKRPRSGVHKLVTDFVHMVLSGKDAWQNWPITLLFNFL